MKKKFEEGYINEVATPEIISALSSMEANPTYLTKASYRGASERWTDNYTSFIDYHVNYLRIHPTLDPRQYIANLRLKLRK